MFATIQGITLHYTIEGAPTGTPLVFINSLGSDLRIWEQVSSHFADQAPIIRYDKRGHGLSACPPGPYTLQDHAADLAGLLAHLAIDEVILIGISVGGQIALAYTLAHPEKVKALVLCNTGAKIGTDELWDNRIKAISEQSLAVLADILVARWFTLAFTEKQPAAFQGYRNMLRRTPADGYLATCAALRAADLSADVGRIPTRTLVLCGAEDIATPPSLGQALASAMPNARFALIEQAAHLSCVEQPDAVASQIAQFLQEDEITPDDRFERGMKIRRSVLGNAHVDRAEANKTAFDADFQRYITETAWGTVWARPGLTRKTRHILTIAILAALGKEHELTLHLRATQNTGVTPDDVKEIFHQIAVYAGVPAANTAFNIAKAVYREREKEKNA
ncbi:MAG: 3-oxoadipate enol-lactonase [Caldilineaceae bacterium]